MKRLRPGIYVDEEGRLHVFIAELLDYLGFPDTEEHRERALRQAERTLRELWPEVELEVTE